MSGLFGGGKKATTHATRAMGIDFQGAQYGPVIPVVYGRNKVPGNCIWYGDFQSHAQQQKAGKGGGGGSTTNYTYSASAQMGLCEGPGIGLQTVYDGTSVVNLSSLNYAFASGAIGQAPWSHLSGNAALGYSLTAIFSFQNLDLGSQASLPNYNYEVNALKQFSGSIPDANPRDILSDICSDPYHGVNFPFLGDLTQYSNYSVANSLFLSPVYDQQQTATQALSDLFKYTNTYVYYSEDQLKVVPLGDTAVTGNGVTFTPNVTPVVNLGTDDFIADGSGATITVDRKAPQDNLNLVRVEFKDRSNTYHDSAIVAAIDEDIITNGGRSDTSETVNGCTSAAVARFIGQNLVQRAFYVRNTYQFKLSWRYCYLEPTDIVTLTDAALGLNLYPVRITEIEEDGDSALTITAEEFPEGIGHSAIYNTQPNGGTNIDQNADPGAVNPPFLFRGPGFLVTGSNPEIWCAVNGSDPMWAGCDVYLSHDGSSYTFAGTVASQARYGSLTTALAAGTADPDTTNTPTVQVYAPAELLGGSQTDADNFVTLAMVDTEVFAYETATLQAANTYQLGYLRRGGYGSANVAHSVGAPFVRLDDSIFRMPVDPSLIGSTVYLKFLSINAFGRTPRTLAEETAYQYVVGTNVELPDVPNVPDNFAVAAVADGVSITWTNDNPAAVGCTSIEYATASSGPWTVLAQVGPTTTAYHHSFTTGATYYYRMRARGYLVQSGWSDYTNSISNTGVNVTGPGGALDQIASEVSNAQADANTANAQLANIASDNILSPAEKPTVERDYSVITTEQAGIDAQALAYLRVGSSQQVAYDNAITALTTYLNGLTTPTAWNDKSGNTTIVGATFRANFNAVYTARQALLDQIYAVAQSLASASGDNLLFNPSFQLNASGTPANASLATGAACTDGWYVYSQGGGINTQMRVLSGTAPYLFFIVNNGVVIPANSGYSIFSRVVSRPIAVNAGDVLTIGGMAYGQVDPGLSMLSRVGLYVHSASGTTAEVTGNDQSSFYGAQASKPYVYTVPANVSLVQLELAFFVANNTASPITTANNNTQASFLSAWVTRNDLRVAGSGTQIGDQRQLPPIGSANLRSTWTGQSISYSATSGTPATATISVTAATLLMGGTSIAYNAMSVGVTGTNNTNVTFYLYLDDPTYAGGARTLVATTTGSNIYGANGRVYVGSVAVTFPTSGSGSGGGSGGGGACVVLGTYGPQGRFDRETRCVYTPDGAVSVRNLKTSHQKCVRVEYDNGTVLTCSEDAPLMDGQRKVLAINALGEILDTSEGPSRVCGVESAGILEVVSIDAGDVAYYASNNPDGPFALHHNKIIP